MLPCWAVCIGGGGAVSLESRLVVRPSVAWYLSRMWYHRVETGPDHVTCVVCFSVGDTEEP